MDCLENQMDCLRVQGFGPQAYSIWSREEFKKQRLFKSRLACVTLDMSLSPLNLRLRI